MRHLIVNSDMDFVHAVLLEVPAGPILDIRIRTARTNIPREWEYPAFDVLRKETSATVTFQRPSNWPRIEVEIVAPNAVLFGLDLVRITPRAQEVICAELQHQSIAFLGLARDCERLALESVAVMQRLGRYFGASVIHVCENDSTDGTGACLQQLADEGVMQLHSFEGLSSKLPRRTERLAFLRNYLNEIAIHTPDLNYVCWMDMDGYVDENFNEQGFLSCFNNLEAWDGVFPTMEGFYYDVWALRHKTMWPQDCVSQINSEWDLALGARVTSQAPVLVRQISAQHMAGWLPVDSAFGGMAIYKADACKKGRYVGLVDGHETCEHVMFNNSIGANGGRLWINPLFRLKSPIDRVSPF